jgi:hypothetical protein
VIQIAKTLRIVAFVYFAVLVAASPALALYVPNKLFGAMYTDYGDMPGTTLNHPFFESITPIPSQYVIDETGITGAFPPVTEPDGVFERNEHVARFATNGETVNGQATGHKFQRRESWDIAFDMKIESPNVAPRKEAGLYFKSSVGNALFLATTNATHYGPGPGEITTIFDNVIPAFSFSGGGGPLGDYSLNGVVDASDYVIWRDTLGSTTDFRANGNNEGASMDLIDQADYDTWAGAFGSGSPSNVANYAVGDTLRMRLIYTPPVLFDEMLPDVADDLNVMTPGKMEYRISTNGGPVLSSGELDFANAWQGLPKDTLIMLRVQNLGTAAVVNDSSKVTFSSFDFNGDAPGSGFGAGAGLAGNVPEPSSVVLLGIALGMIGVGRRGSR